MVEAVQGLSLCERNPSWTQLRTDTKPFRTSQWRKGTAWKLKSFNSPLSKLRTYSGGRESNWTWQSKVLCPEFSTELTTLTWTQHSDSGNIKLAGNSWLGSRKGSLSSHCFCILSSHMNSALRLMKHKTWGNGCFSRKELYWACKPNSLTINASRSRCPVSCTKPRIRP